MCAQVIPIVKSSLHFTTALDDGGAKWWGPDASTLSLWYFAPRLQYGYASFTSHVCILVFIMRLLCSSTGLLVAL